MVTSAAARSPKQNVAAYTALKGAAEHWVQALGDSFKGTPARSVILAVIALVDATTREKNPDKTYANFTDVVDLGTAVWIRSTAIPTRAPTSICRRGIAEQFCGQPARRARVTRKSPASSVHDPTTASPTAANSDSICGGG